jgi:carbon monoxide dehydrogenase subunit G
MELTNDFTVAAPLDEAWPLLTDIERIAPCVPGFKLTGQSDGEYQGTMKVKVGAVQTSYECVIRFVELDEQGHRAVIAARGNELRGQGGVTASITSTLSPAGEGSTRASVITDLDVTGRVAQFGRGILADVSNRLVNQFVRKLETTILAGQAQRAGAAPSTDAGEGAPQPRATAAAEPSSSGDEEDDALNLLSVAGAPMVKRLIPVAVALLVLVLLIRALRR